MNDLSLKQKKKKQKGGLTFYVVTFCVPLVVSREFYNKNNNEKVGGVESLVRSNLANLTNLVIYFSEPPYDFSHPERKGIPSDISPIFNFRSVQ